MLHLVTPQTPSSLAPFSSDFQTGLMMYKPLHGLGLSYIGDMLVPVLTVGCGASLQHVMIWCMVLRLHLERCAFTVAGPSFQSHLETKHLFPESP